MAHEYITSKNLFLLICDTLRIMNEELMDHGQRVGYIVMEMLQTKGGFEKFEMADLLLLCIMHDIGAYKTEKVTPNLEFDIKDSMPHAIYGYLFLKYLSPQEDNSKIILYHHIKSKVRAAVKYDYIHIADYLAVAELYDIFRKRYVDKFEYKVLEKYVDKRYSKEAYDLLEKTVLKTKFDEKLDNGSYMKDIEALLDYVLFSDSEKEMYLKMLMYTVGLKTEYSVIDTISCICVAKEIANHLELSKEDQMDIYYGALLHDLGMLSIPREILDLPRKLTNEEMDMIRTHVSIAENLLTGRLEDRIVKIACRHHERLDGSGYPKQLQGKTMNIKECILQVSDTVIGMTNKRAYRNPKTKEEVTKILTEELVKGRYHEKVVNVFLNNYDEIMQKVRVRSEASLVMHNKLSTQYSKVYNNFVN